MFNLKSPKLNVTETPPQPEHIYLTRGNKIVKLAGMHSKRREKEMLGQCLDSNVGFGAVVFIEEWFARKECLQSCVIKHARTHRYRDSRI